MLLEPDYLGQHRSAVYAIVYVTNVAQMRRRPFRFYNEAHNLGDAATGLYRIKIPDSPMENVPVNGGRRFQNCVHIWLTEAVNLATRPDIVASTSPCPLSIQHPPRSMPASDTSSTPLTFLTWFAAMLARTISTSS